MMVTSLLNKVRDFRDDQKGVIAIETVILIPILIWGYIAMFTIFDTFRQYTTQQKAAYTVADLISRQVTPLDADFLDGSHELFIELSRLNVLPGMRVTVAKYDTVNQEYVVFCSRTRGGIIGLQSADIADWSDKLPELAEKEQVTIVETRSIYTPFFEIGLGDRSIGNFVFTRPRYATQLCYFDGFVEICDLPTAEPPKEAPNEQA